MPGGRPRIIKDLDELDTAINRYFDSITDPTTKQYIRPPTHIGLAIGLGFTSRQSLYDYAGRDDRFSYPIKMAMAKIEQYTAEQAVARDKPAGAIFILKNMGYADKQVIEHEGEIGSVIRTELPTKKDLGAPITPESAGLST